MKQLISKIIIASIAIVVLLMPGCTPDPILEGFDITVGTWGIAMTFPDRSPSVIYDFRGSLSSGDVYYQQSLRGTYSVMGNAVTFTTTHYDPDNNAFIYAFVGRWSDAVIMEGNITVTNPDGTLEEGTFTAAR